MSCGCHHQLSRFQFYGNWLNASSGTNSQRSSTEAFQLDSCPNGATESHNTRSCQVWSCSFLPSPRNAVLEDLDAGTRRCLYCDRFWYRSVESSKSATNYADEVHHLAERHGYRSCDQTPFSSEDSFRMHLIIDHQAEECEVFPVMKHLLDACRSKPPLIPQGLGRPTKVESSSGGMVGPLKRLTAHLTSQVTTHATEEPILGTSPRDWDWLTMSL